MILLLGLRDMDLGFDPALELPSVVAPVGLEAAAQALLLTRSEGAEGDSTACPHVQRISAHAIEAELVVNESPGEDLVGRSGGERLAHTTKRGRHLGLRSGC